jgi:6-phosphogluconolactonase/glucosamine-6-phosphate isomerase/deaminase
MSTKNHIANSLLHFKSIPDLSLELNSIIEKASKLARDENRIFTLAVSGGSYAKQLAAYPFKHSTQHWKILFCDERCVELHHADSNHALFISLFKVIFFNCRNGT